MEFRNDIRLTLKSSCDACTESKVKCTGEDPCTRCAKKGVQCFYSPKKKRGPERKRERSGLVSNQPMVMRTNITGNSAQMSSLGAHERRSWSIFFTLYKHYAVSCSLFWFNRQLHKMRMYLIKQDNQDALKRLNSWMEALNIDIDDLTQRVTACQLKISEWGKAGQERQDARPPPPPASGADGAPLNLANVADHLNLGNPFHLRVHGSVAERVPAALPHPPFSAESAQAKALGGFSAEAEEAFIKFKVDYMAPGAHPEVVASAAFESLMGYGGPEIESDLRASGGGFLPWGGDVLSRILMTEADLLSFVQILAIKFNTLGKPDSYPIVREIPSVHLFHVNWHGAEAQGPVQCVVKCVHRERISDDESSLDVFMSFAPVGPPQPHRRVLIPDSHAVRVEDHVQLPPKRARRGPGAALAAGGAEELAADGEGVYNFGAAQADLLAASDGGQDVFIKRGGAHQMSFETGAGGLLAPDGAGQLLAQASFASADGMFGGEMELALAGSRDDDDTSGVASPDERAYNAFTRQGDGALPLEGLPLKDGDWEDEEADDEFLDNLLDWVGPAVTMASQPPMGH